MGRVSVPIILDKKETETLEHWQRSSTMSSGLCFRAGIVQPVIPAKKLLSVIELANKQYRSGGDASHNIDLPVYPMRHVADNPGDMMMPKYKQCWMPR